MLVKIFALLLQRGSVEERMELENKLTKSQRSKDVALLEGNKSCAKSFNEKKCMILLSYWEKNGPMDNIQNTFVHVHVFCPVLSFFKGCR